METLFSLSGMIILPVWLALALLPFRWPGASRFIQWSVPVALSAGYTFLIILHWGERSGGYGSLADLRALFSQDALLFAGWLHYLAFDLFIGAWIVQRARTKGIRHGWTLPCLALTFLFGPAGLLLYIVLEGGHRLRTSTLAVTP